MTELDSESQFPETPADATAQPPSGSVALSLRGVGPAIIDQALVSGTNFFTVLLLARAVSPRDLGVYSVILAIGILMANCQSSVIAQPLSVLGVAKSGQDFLAYLAATARLQGLATALTIAGAAIVMFIAHTMAPNHLTRDLLIAIPFYAAWQLQEFARRALFAENRPRSVLINDIVSYGVQLIILVALFAAGELTVPVALGVAALTSTAGILLAFVQVKALRHAPAALGPLWREHWLFGRFLLLADGMQALSSRLYIYLSAALLATAATGVLQAIGQVPNVMNVFMFALMSTLMPRFGRALATEGVPALHRATKQWLVITTAGAALLMLIPFIWPGFTLHLLFGDQYTSYESLLRLQVVVELIWIPTYMLTLAVRVHRANWVFPVNQAMNMTIALTLGAYLLLAHGLRGALIASGVAAVASIVLLTVVYRKADRRARIGEVGASAP